MFNYLRELNFVSVALRLLLSAVIGAIIYYIVMQVVLWLGLPTNYLKLLTALVVAMFLAVPHWKSQLFTARSARKGEKQNA